MVVAAISEANSTDPPNPNKNPNVRRRTPLLPSEKDNGILISRLPKSKPVSSRYMYPSPSNTIAKSTMASSCSSSRRCPSPASTPSSIGVVSRPNRSQSVDRRRPSTPRPMTPVVDSRQGNVGDVSAATKMLITSSRSLSVSFQGESFSLPISKNKTPTVTSVRRATPERRKPLPVKGKGDVEGGNQGENSKPGDQHRWPARLRQVNLESNMLSRSMNCNGIGSGRVVRALHQSGMDESRQMAFDGRLRNAELPKAVQGKPDAGSVNDLTASDTDSVSSGSTSEKQDCAGIAKGRTGPRGIVVSARFWQETNSRLRRLQDLGSPLLGSPVSKTAAAAKFAQSRKFTSDSPISSPTSLASPVRGATRPASPSKLWTSAASSPSRGNLSPSRVRNCIDVSATINAGNMPSILSFSVDIRRGKVGENRIIDAHVLRLLYNRYLQWLFVNARADATFRVQRQNAEKSLWNAWVTLSELRHSVTLKRIKVLLLRKKLRLTSVLKGQMSYLEEWALLDRDHSNSLLGATEALKASTLRLPVVGKTTADIQNLKDAVRAAHDVMQKMATSICPLSSMVEDLNSLVTELANVTAKERMLLDQCKEILSTLAAMQVKECSLRTHILQLNRTNSRD